MTRGFLLTSGQESNSASFPDHDNVSSSRFDAGLQRSQLALGPLGDQFERLDIPLRALADQPLYESLCHLRVFREQCFPEETVEAIPSRTAREIARLTLLPLWHFLILLFGNRRTRSLRP
jgi:hypothetical protein